MRIRRQVGAVLALAALPTVLAVHPAAAETEPRTQGCITSVPEPETTDPVSICYTLYKPPAASVTSPVPVVLHSHGWGGSRTNSATAFASWLAAGYGVLSFDQRGFGESGGAAHIENPDFEGQDVRRLVDLVASLDWAQLDGPGDPRIGAIGGSYGGGYQFVGAFADLMARGRRQGTRFDALAPEITWWDLKESLAPQSVARSLWTTALFAAGATSVPDEVVRGFAYGAATGDWPTGELGLADLDAFFERNGPRWHVNQGRRLDIPVLFGQGITDNLFPLDQALDNFRFALTRQARANSILVGYNGGHALPSVLPTGVGDGTDPCSAQLTGVAGDSFGDLALRFFDEHLKRGSRTLSGYGRYHLATAGGRCQSVKSVAPTRSIPLASMIRVTGAGAPLAVPVAAGPLTVAGESFVDATVTTLVPKSRLFLSLAVGTNALDAKIIQNNMLPLNEPVAVTGAARTIELPAVAVDVPAGQQLFLMVSPVSDMSFGHGSRVPGPVTLDDVVVRVSVV